VNVLLVNMPFGSVTRPALSLGLLKSELAASGVPARVENLALSFAEMIGRDEYLYLSDRTPPELLAGDWIFSACLFGDDPDRADAFERLATSPGFAADFDVIRHARSCAEGFVRRCLAAVDWAAYDVVGFTSTFAQNGASLALARRVKELHRSCLIVLGGANCEDQMGLTLHRCFPFVDFVCSGEADLSFPRLVQSLGTDGRPADIPGVVARGRGGSVCRSLSPERVLDLDELPYPSFDEFFEQVGPGARKVVVMETSRGCWWGDKHHCTFCGIDFPLRYRSKSSDRALDELLWLRARYDARMFVMADEILDMRYFREFIPRLAELREPVSIFYETKANLTKDQVRLLARAGICQIQPGIESLSGGVLRLIDKGVTPAQNVQLLKWCEECGIEPRWNILYGVPGEDPADYTGAPETVAALEHLRPPQACGPIRLDRFSPYFTAPAAHGIASVRPSAAYGLVYDLPSEALAGLAYYFDFDFADGRDPDAYTRKLRRAVASWTEGYRAGRLVFADDGEHVTIVDRRGGGVRTYRYSGWRRQAYLECDVARPRARLEALAEDRGVSARQLHRFLAELIEARLLLDLDGRCVSLAVRSADHPEDLPVLSAAEERVPTV
jgi:ribosomal peptide maturation radical SAM protein 1